MFPEAPAGLHARPMKTSTARVAPPGPQSLASPVAPRPGVKAAVSRLEIQFDRWSPVDSSPCREFPRQFQKEGGMSERRVAPPSATPTRATAWTSAMRVQEDTA
eukprot:scaffold602_cov298-Pinguiococcus_pyrenoidosus.AAC.52